MVATGVRVQEERGYSARYLILIFLACVATCAVFFSMGFMVGYNERFSRSTPRTEFVNTPTVVPPTVNPPVESVQVTPPGSATGHPPANPAPDTSLTPPGGARGNPAELPAKDLTRTTSALQSPTHNAAPVKPQPSAQPVRTPSPREVGEGVTLQVAALRTKQDAEALVTVLKGRGYPVFLVAPEYAHANDNLFRVQVGPFKTRDDAEKARTKLSHEGFNPFIRH
jgi:DedD protein